MLSGSLVHPEEDKWTDIELSNLFYDRLVFCYF